MIAATQLWWHVARVGGLVSWALVAASVIFGLMLSTKTLPKHRRPNWVLDLHRFLGGLSVVFAAVHIAGLMLDNYIGFGPTEVLVPFTSAYRPGAVALGVIAMYMLVAVEITSLMRKQLTKRTWKLVHMLSFVLFAMGSVHVILAGTDAGIGWIEYTVFITTAVVAGLTIIRIDQARKSPDGSRTHRSRPQAQLGRRSPHPSAAVRSGRVAPRPAPDQGAATFAPSAPAGPDARPMRRPPLTTTGSTSHRTGARHSTAPPPVRTNQPAHPFPNDSHTRSQR